MFTNPIKKLYEGTPSATCRGSELARTFFTFAGALVGAAMFKSRAAEFLICSAYKVFDVARNMGTSVQVIRNCFGRHAKPRKLATQFGG
jgi:hypothetical protein